MGGQHLGVCMEYMGRMGGQHSGVCMGHKAGSMQVSMDARVCRV